MVDNKLHVRDQFYLSGVEMTDKLALVRHLQAKEIYDTTLNIPYPYSEQHADDWLTRRIESRAKQTQEVSFALRNSAGQMIGVVSSDSHQIGTSHRAEIGYWLAFPYWGRGLMTDAVRAYVKYAFTELQLLRLTAHVFEFNPGSIRVLEKNGFQLEGHLRKHVRKEGRLFDVRFYGLLKDEWSDRAA